MLRANFRNGQAVTGLANRLLKIKHVRFGSIDRETNFLVQSCASQTGSVQLLADKDGTRREFNSKTRGSTQFAVLVLRDEDKAAVRQQFQTPLVFSVHEAKGLEYANVILVDMVSGQRQAFAEIAQGVQARELHGDDLTYSRGRDKTDHALELFKFYVNALYVAMTRVVENLYLLEADTTHPLLQLLDLRTTEATTLAQAQTSSQQEFLVTGHAQAVFLALVHNEHLVAVTEQFAAVQARGRRQCGGSHQVGLGAGVHVVLPAGMHHRVSFCVLVSGRRRA